MSRLNDLDNFAGRVNFADLVIRQGRETSRSFDNCFENYDGAAVALALYRRAQKKPDGALARNLWNYLGRNEVTELAVKNMHRTNLAAWSRELIEASLRRESQPFEKEYTSEGEQTLVPGVAPITPRELLERQMQKPLSGGAAPCNKGLFDTAGRSQLDMLNLI